MSRFEWGLTAELLPPDVETRMAILRKKEKAMGVELPGDIINFLASRIRTNIRRLEGALIRVASFASLTGKKVTVNQPGSKPFQVDEMRPFPPEGKNHESKDVELTPGANSFSVKFTSPDGDAVPSVPSQAPQVGPGPPR